MRAWEGKGFTATVLATISLSLLSATSWALDTAPEENIQQNKALPLEDIQRFSTAIGQIKKYYVKNVDDSKLFENAIRGMLSGLDPHSSYLDIEEYNDLKSATRGDFGGLGIEVTMEGGVIKVVSPIDDTPAHRAGIKSGDLIIRIGDTPIKQLSLREAVAKMRGPKDSEVTLTIIRKNAQKPIITTVKRDIIKIQSVKSELLENGYGYVRISQFQMPTGKNMVQAIEKLQSQSGGKLQGLVLDLRNNPGGLLDSAVEVSDAFLDNKKLAHEQFIVYTKGRLPGSKFEAKASAGDILSGAPIVILINEGSASGSEIVAGALQDHKRAILMGTRTFGKGSVQTVIPLDEYRGVKLTTALYYTPKGTSIQAKGIEPDILMEDIAVTAKNGTENTMINYLREADLDGHLSNGNIVKEPQDLLFNKKEAPNDKKVSLAVRDYQLHQALILLKGLQLTKNYAQ
ncbi:MAG: S41 family peptidase [Gammaproteobacteria bacterium]